MYPKLSFHLQQIIADVLNDAEPIEEQPTQLMERRKRKVSTGT